MWIQPIWIHQTWIHARANGKGIGLFLKDLTLKGFKSFADKTTLEFEPGVAVVVGPNGSGKSNLVDAVAWVLGAQGARSLRGAKMDDVIFAGTVKRSPLGRAEVSLTIDNAAGLLPIEFSEVTITRILFRSGESEYQINGVPCRLLDIQELLSDSGVGRTQHVIVGQGQIDEVLNSKPEERRAIIEEAAGILKFRRRKERAQRRLDATEGNLLRLQDLLREVRRQLRPLERQAEAARVYDSLVNELHTIRLYLHGRELVSQETKLNALAERDRDLGRREAELREALRVVDADIVLSEGELNRLRDDDSSAIVARVDALRERARGLFALVAERRRGIERAMAATADSGLAASLADEAGQLREQLSTVDIDAHSLVPLADEVDAADIRTVELETRLAELGEQGPRPNTAAELRAQLDARRTAIGRGRDERGKRVARLEQLDALLRDADADQARRRSESDDAAERVNQRRSELVVAEEHRQRVEQQVSAADDSLRQAESAAARWQARAETLAMALDEARSAAGAEHIADLDGVVGPLVDLLEIDSGLEQAVAVALGESLRAVVVRDTGAARRAVQRLREGELQALLLVANSAASPSPAALTMPSTPPGSRLLSQGVRGRTADVEATVRRLLGGTVVFDGHGADALAGAIEWAHEHPGRLAVTAAGDGIRSDGPWRIGRREGGAVTQAALDSARERAAEAAAARQLAAEHRATSAAELDDARRVEAERRGELAVAERAERGALDAVTKAEASGRDASVEYSTIEARIVEIDQQLGADEAMVVDLLARLPEAQTAEQAWVHERTERDHLQQRLDRHRAAAAALRRDLEVKAAGLDERRTLISRRLTELDERMLRLGQASDDAQRRRDDLARSLAWHDAITRELERVLDSVIDRHDQIHATRRAEIEAARAVATRLESMRQRRSGHERTLEETLEHRRRAEIETTETRLRLEQTVEAIRRDHDVEPEVAVAAEVPESADGSPLPARARELDRELKRMGPINPLALEEFTALKERHDFLETQLEDVRNSRRELSKIIRAVDQEIVERFASAYADVERHFEELFVRLFPGGAGRLRLVDPDNILDTGIDIEARPSGKNVKRLSLLSGGERSLTALAFLFGVYKARPSPFYVLDEVDAALDDVNLHRFVDLVNLFRDDAQLIIVSHQKRTMEAAEVLYGVSMAPGGSTVVLGERSAVPMAPR